MPAQTIAKHGAAKRHAHGPDTRVDSVDVWRIKDGRFRCRPLEEATLAATEPTKAPRSQEMRRTWMSVGENIYKNGSEWT